MRHKDGALKVSRAASRSAPEGAVDESGREPSGPLPAGDPASEVNAAEQRFRDFAEVASDWLWEMDRDFRFTFISSRIREISGIDPEFFIGRKRWELAPSGQENTGPWKQHREDLENHRPFRKFRYVVQTPDGRTVYLRVSGKPVFDRNDDFVGYRGSGTEETVAVTDRKRAESAENVVRSITWNLPGVVYRRALHTDGSITVPYISSETNRTMGMASDRIMADPDSALATMDPDDRRVWIAAMKESARTLAPVDVETRCRDGDGQPVWFRHVGRPRKDADGTIVWDVMALDITGQKQSEEKATDLAANLGQILRNSASEIYFFDPDSWKFLEVSKGALDNLGYTLEELHQMTPADLDLSFNEADTRRLFERISVPGEAEALRETRNRRKDGTVYPVELRMQTARLGGRTVFMALGHDISDRRAAEEILRSSEERLRGIIDNSPAQIALKDRDGRYIMTNRRLREVFGVSEDEIRGRTISEFAPPGVTARIRDAEKRVLESGEPDTEEAILKIGDRSYVMLETRFPIRNAAGEIEALGIIATDVTGRQRVEEAQRGRNRVLELIASGGALQDSLDLLAHVTEESLSNAWCIVRRIDGEAGILRLVASAALPENLREIFGSSKIAADAGPCGQAAHFAERVIKTDLSALSRDPVRGKAIAGAGIEAAWCEPIISFHGEILGTVTIYSREQREPTSPESEILRSAAHIAGIALERKISEDQLRASEARFRDVAEVASDWFWEMDENLEITWISDRLLAVTGVDPEGLIGRTRRDLAGDADTDDPEKWEAHFEDLEAHRPFRDFRYNFRSADGQIRHWSISGKPIFDESEKFTGFRGTGTDITAETRIAEAERQAREEAEIASRAKSEFLANMSHELRTPLNAIIGFSEVILGELMGPLGTPQYKDYASDIHESGKHLLSLINDILDLSKIEAGKVDLDNEEVDLSEVVASSIRIVRERAAASEIGIADEVPADLPRVRVDLRAMKQVLINLLSNAVKFSPAGGHVTVAARVADDGGLVLSVADTGIGIAPEDLPKAMSAFVQIDSTYSRRHEGTGLGLPLVKSLVELHDGRFALESAPGDGTVATVFLPAWRTVSP